MTMIDPDVICQCSSCGKEYINERELLKHDNLISVDDEPKRLLRKVLEIFDTCIYCDGKLQS